MQRRHGRRHRARVSSRHAGRDLGSPLQRLSSSRARSGAFGDILLRPLELRQSPDPAGGDREQVQRRRLSGFPGDAAADALIDRAFDQGPIVTTTIAPLPEAQKKHASRAWVMSELAGDSATYLPSAVDTAEARGPQSRRQRSPIGSQGRVGRSPIPKFTCPFSKFA